MERYWLADAILPEVKPWREEGYPGITDVTRELLDYWFKTDHITEDGELFRFWDCQQEAIETLIYLHESDRYRQKERPRLKRLLEEREVSRYKAFGYYQIDVDRMEDIEREIEEYDPFPKYAFRMATGSGKTMVMGMAIAWLYLNGYSKHFLVLSPNLIVLERLILGFRDESVFDEFPIIPPERRAEFHPQVIVQDQTENESSPFIIYVTNIQQLYEKEREGGRVENPVSQMAFELDLEELGEEFYHNALLYRIAGKDDLVILNDEAHHVHSAYLKWAEVIDLLHQNRPLKMQLDFSATPRHPDTGRPFPHTIYNYPLKRAIDEGIVKDVTIATYEGVETILRAGWLGQHQFSIDEGVRKLEEIKEQLVGTKAKPILFIMADLTKHANEVADYLKAQYPPYRDRILVIHTNRQGDIYKYDLDLARQQAREIDNRDNPYEIIVSVLMLKEGWDVKNVNVIVPLRKAGSLILVEQTLGRGLRRVFGTNWEIDEELIVIEHPSFRQFWEAEIRDNELAIKITTTKRPLKPKHVIKPQRERAKYDMTIPILRGGVTQVGRVEVEKIDVSAMRAGGFRLADIDTKVRVRSKRLGEEREEIEERAQRFDNLYQLVLADLTKATVKEHHLTSNYCTLLAPLIDEYIKVRLFDDAFDPLNREHVHKLQTDGPVSHVIDAFRREIRKQTIQKQAYQPSYRPFNLLETEAWLTSQELYEGKKCVFDRLPYRRAGGGLERDFMRYLDDQRAVQAWTKIFGKIPLRIPYGSPKEGLHYYVPDFVVGTQEAMYLIETKGEGWGKQVTVEMKKEVAQRWCERASEVTAPKWVYVKLMEDVFRQYGMHPFSQLIEHALRSDP